MSSKKGSSYEALNTPIERLDPITKFMGILVLGISTLLFPHFILGYILLIGLFFVAYYAKILKNFSKFIIGFAIPILVMLLFIQGLYYPQNETIIADFGFAQLGLEGIYRALSIVGALLVFLGSFYITTKSTETGRMVAAFRRIGITGKFGYLLLATLNVVPQMNKKVTVIRQAQNARGLETTGKLKNRINAFVPLIGPLVMGSLIDVQERGMTLEVRGFSVKGVKQTSFVEAIASKADIIIKRILILFFVLIVISTVLIRFQII